MGEDAFVVVFLKPEIATGFFKFATRDNDSESEDTPSSIPGVSAVEAAFLLPNGHIIPLVLNRIKDKGFEIVQRRMYQFTKADARHLFTYEQQYRFKEDPEAFAAFLNSITSGPSLALVLKLPTALALGDANAAIKKWVELAGDWDPVVARKKALAASTPHDHALLPVIGCFLGKCDGQEQFESLQIAAKAQGFVWVDCTSTPSAQKLRELLLRAHAGREKFLLYGYPQTSAQAAEFLDLVGSPQFVIHNSSASPVAPELLAVFDAHPDISQLDLASFQSSNGASKLRSTFSRKQVVAVVGSVDTLQLPQLRDAVAPLGYDVIEFNHDQVWHDDVERVHEFERQVQAVQAPRCLVIGAPEISSFYKTMENRIGSSMHKILILQHVKVRVRAPDAMDDEDSAGDSDEERGHVHMDDNGSDGDDNANPAIRWRKVLQALSPQLLQLVQTSASTLNSSISIDVVGFLENTPRGSSRVVQDVVARLRPRLFGVVGHRFSFYQTAARGFCRRHLVGFLDLTNVPSNREALQQVETIVATTPHSSYCLDGFPRSSLPDAITASVSSTPRYVAQQLWELDRRLGKMTTLVHFTATLEVLEERTPRQVSRRMLELAQDDLEQTSTDLVRWFTTGKNHQTITEVTCDRTVEDAQKEMVNVLQWTLRPSRPAIKQKGV
ncbi:hypothetical protein JG687_00009085 [Phytophthora cactorum]|uniref:Nucleoside diphosphate kinase-like domain-containing protein n=1 Tax=Phytophthora cactorum TaxID=29920 RepID=A0A8T1UD32_9STRA|nr:hypothetical protein JG687_00009085 [Phytophthora cactorum]